MIFLKCLHAKLGLINWFKSKEDFIKHAQNEHKEDKNFCQVFKANLHTCRFCNRDMKNEKNLKEHFNDVHEKRLVILLVQNLTNRVVYICILSTLVLSL